MSQYTPIERSEFVELYIQNQKSIILTQRAFRAKFPRQKPPDPKTIRALYTKFVSTGSLCNVTRGEIQRRARSKMNITAILKDLAENPNATVLQRADAFGISYKSMQRILRNDLNLRPFKVIRKTVGNQNWITLYRLASHFQFIITHFHVFAAVRFAS